jgi:hypothetical protein
MTCAVGTSEALKVAYKSVGFRTNSKDATTRDRGETEPRKASSVKIS